jgi:hypothetical protein
MKSVRIWNSALLLFLSLLLFRVLVDLTYVYVVSPTFGYAGLTVDVSTYKLVWSYVLTLILALNICFDLRRGSDYFTLLLALFVVMPILSLWGLRNEANDLPLASVVCVILISVMMRYSPNVVLLRLRQATPALWIILAALTTAFVGILLFRGGLRYLNFSITQVYDVRGDIQEKVLFGFAGYLYIWFGKCVIPVVTGLGLWKRNYLMVAGGLAAGMLVFGVTSHKEMVSYPLVVIVVYLGLGGGMNRLRLLTVLGLCSLLGLALLISLSRGGNLIAALLTMRTVHVIAENHFLYFQFFDHHPFVYWSNGILDGFVRYPYTQKIPILIGADRYGMGGDAFANAGMIASGYMQGGYPVLVLYVMLTAVMFRVFDWLALDASVGRLAISIAATSALQLINTDLTIALLSQGTLLNFVLLWLLKPAPRRTPATAMPPVRESADPRPAVNPL